MTAVERAARAIAPKAWWWYGRIGDNIAQESRRTASLKHARAVIASLREPTPAMLRAWFDDTGAINEFSARAWERGIDAALTETDEGAARD